MREIKFRAWVENEMHKFYLGEWLTDRKEKIVDFNNVPVMQFIGLKDKNGKEIYEGDIVKVETNVKLFIGMVKWNAQSASFVFSNDKRYLEIISCAQFGGDDYPIIHMSGAEVIGNIYETPELLTTDSNTTDH